MGSLQKKEMEVSRRMKKKKMRDIQKQSCPAYILAAEGKTSCSKEKSDCATLSLSRNTFKQSNNTLHGLGPSKEASVKASQAWSSEPLMKFSLLDPKCDQKSPSDLGQDNSCGWKASLDDESISEYSAQTSDRTLEVVESVHLNPSANKSNISSAIYDASSKPVTMLADATSEAEDGWLSYKKEEPSVLESLREQVLSLSNLTVNEPIPLANISRTSSLLNLLNYFPQKAPIVCSRKKLLILDINGILADIVYPPPKGYKADTKIAGRAVFTRPYCSDFLNFCLERFNVAIWSSRSRKIIDRLISYLMGDIKHKLIFCWDLCHCTESKFKTLENKHKALVFKELGKVWDRHDPDLPWDKGHFNESNTLLLDDTPYKALLNPPHTAIFPYSYDFKDRTDNAIGPGCNIRAYLEELAVADNVQNFVEQHPFGQSAITERSLSWRFYSKVIKGQSAVPARR